MLSGISLKECTNILLGFCSYLVSPLITCNFFLLYPIPSTQLSFVIPLLLPYKSMAKACERHITNYCFTCHFYLPEISNRVEIRFQTTMINSYPRDKRITNYRAQDSFPRRTWCTSAKMGSTDHHEGRPES